jgi:hypothetical protein
MKKILIGFLCLILSAGAICAENFKLPLKIDTGFFERKDALVKSKIDFKKAVDLKGIKLIKGDKEIPFAFIPDGEYKGTLFWILKGNIPSMTQEEFTLKLSDGAWDNSPVGDPAVMEKAKCESNIAPNPSFEIIEDCKKKSNWNGEKAPQGWDIRDFAWAHRKLPDIKSTCRISEKEVHDGKKALEFITQLRDDKKDKDGNKTNLIGYAISPEFPLKPDTEYQFSYYVKFTEVIDNGKKSQAISASVNFLGEDKKRIHPRNYSVNRLQCAYLLTRYPKKDYMNKWVKVEYRKKTPPEVRYGQIWLSGSFSGKAYVDNFTLKEITKAANPIKVEQGKIETIK